MEEMVMSDSDNDIIKEDTGEDDLDMSNII